MSSKAIFLDRDGTINVDYGYMYKPEAIEFIDGALQALKLFESAGYKLIIITNQSGIGRGYFSQEQYDVFSSAFNARLAEQGVTITATKMCPHSPDEVCNCRKPNPTMVAEAIEEHDIEASESFMFGDKCSDVECGKAAGVTSHLITEEQNLLYWAKKIVR